jgi:hypothetical protein
MKMTDVKNLHGTDGNGRHVVVPIIDQNGMPTQNARVIAIGLQKLGLLDPAGADMAMTWETTDQPDGT